MYIHLTYHMCYAQITIPMLYSCVCYYCFIAASADSATGILRGNWSTGFLDYILP